VKARVLAIRFSSLGDVLLAAHVPSFLRLADPERRVLFVTKERFAAALRGHPDIDRFYMLEDGSADPAAPAPLGVRGGLGDLMAHLKREGIAEVIDLHQNWRSSRVVGALPRAKRSLPAKHAIRRRLMVHARWLGPQAIPPILQTYRQLIGISADVPVRPWLRAALTDSEMARARERAGQHDFLLLGVGARWETKRWPARHFVALGAAAGRLGLRARYAVAPADHALEDELRSLLSGDPRGEIASLGLRDAAALASFSRAIVSNDSAMLHLGQALGIPTVGVFGSTVPGFGFAPGGPRDAVAEIPLPCRPCDVHGKRRCPLRHHACMERLMPDQVLDAVAALLGRRRTEATTEAPPSAGVERR